MTSPHLFDDLRRDEGLRLEAYPDPLSGGAPWTIGHGHTGPDVHVGMLWSEAQADNALGVDIARTIRALDAQMPWWRKLDDIRQDVIANMAFNLGVGKLETFDTFLAFARARDYAKAGLDLRGTAWARQVGERAHRLSNQMATGVHQP